MAIMVDPTLMMTKRGQDWLRRTSSSSTPVPIWCSSSYMDVGVTPSLYKNSIFASRSAYDWLADDLIGLLRPIAGNPLSADSLRVDRLRSENVSLILDIWHGLIQGLWLVARRPQTFDALVEAGVTIVVRGRDHYSQAFAEAAKDLEGDLAAALDRRVRFLAVINREIDRGMQPIISLYDSGRDGFR